MPIFVNLEQDYSTDRRLTTVIDYNNTVYCFTYAEFISSILPVKLYKYDVGVGTWGLVATMPSSADGKIVQGVVVYGTKIWFVIGYPQTDPRQPSPIEVWNYDSGTATFTQDHTFVGITDVLFGDIATNGGVDLYVFVADRTGQVSDLPGTFDSCIYRRDAGTGLWSAHDTNNNVDRQMALLPIFYNGNLYCVRSEDNSGSSAGIVNFVRIDAVGFTTIYTDPSGFPTVGRRGNAYVFDNKVYLFTSQTNFDVYDGITYSQYPIVVRGTMYIHDRNGRLYMVEKPTPAFPFTNIFYIDTATPTTVSPAVISAQPNAGGRMAYLAATDKLYISSQGQETIPNDPYDRLYYIFDDTIPTTLTYDVRGYGVAIERTVGGELVVTMDDETNGRLVAQKYDTGALAVQEQTILAENITRATVDARIAYAYPIYSYTSDEPFIYGRFYDPNDLPSELITHLIKSTDGGSTWSVVINNFDLSYIGAMRIAPDNSVFLIKNSQAGFISRLYTGGAESATFPFRSIVPFGALVRPHGLTWGESYQLYICSGLPNSYMVARTSYPWVNYSNYTFNHALTDGIYAVEYLGL